MAQRLIGLALDADVPEHVALSAVNSAMDRAGLTSKTALEIGVKPLPYEQLLGLDGGTRADYRRSQGIPDDTPPAPAESPRELPAADPDPGEPLDAELIDAENDYLIVNQPITPDESERGSAGYSAPVSPFAPAPGPGPDGLMPMGEAVSEAARMRRDAVRIRTAQRALPRGRS